MSTLSEMLNKETVALGVTVPNWQEAVKTAGNLLVRAGTVEPRYIDGMIRMVQEIGPYIVIAPGVALPHARPEDGVNKACLSLVTLKPPVKFGNANNDPVELVIAFGSTDNESHIEALSELARLIGDADTLRNLKEASSPEELLEVIKKAELLLCRK